MKGAERAGRDRWTDREGRAEPGFHVFASKWEAGLEGDRLCLLLICQPVNGGKEERAELLSRDQSTQGMMGGKTPPGNKVSHSRSACSHRSSDGRRERQYFCCTLMK